MRHRCGGLVTIEARVADDHELAVVQWCAACDEPALPSECTNWQPLEIGDAPAAAVQALVTEHEQKKKGERRH
jgi:hypothetical protein